MCWTRCSGKTTDLTQATAWLVCGYVVASHDNTPVVINSVLNNMCTSLSTVNIAFDSCLFSMVSKRDELTEKSLKCFVTDHYSILMT